MMTRENHRKRAARARRRARMRKALPNAVDALVLFSAARRIGLRRGRRLLALTAAGYLGEQRRRARHQH